MLVAWIDVSSSFPSTSRIDLLFLVFESWPWMLGVFLVQTSFAPLVVISATSDLCL